MRTAARMIGGVEVHRHRKGDANAKPPFVVVEPAKQRAAMELLEEQVFSAKPFSFPPELYNYLASPRWIHWGTSLTDRVDYPVHQIILSWQGYILSQLLSSTTLTRLHDAELKLPADKDAFTAAELIQRLTRSIYAELEQLKPAEFTNRKPAISSLRRNLQRYYLQKLAPLAMGDAPAPADCQTIAYSQLAGLEVRIKNVLANQQLKLDDYTRSHLEETAARIRKVMDASLELKRP
jgi:hypothetical protein